MKAAHANVRVTQEAIDDAHECLAWGHQWDKVTSGLERDSRRRHMGFRIMHRCMRCGSERERTVDLYGQPMYVTYTYSEAFKQAGRPDAREGQTRVQAQRESYITGYKRATREHQGGTVTTLRRKSRKPIKSQSSTTRKGA